MALSVAVTCASAPCCPQPPAPQPWGDRSRQKKTVCKSHQARQQASAREQVEWARRCSQRMAALWSKDTNLHHGRWIGKGPSILVASYDCWSVSYYGETANMPLVKAYTTPMLPVDMLAWQSKCLGNLMSSQHGNRGSCSQHPQLGLWRN